MPSTACCNVGYSATIWSTPVMRIGLLVAGPSATTATRVVGGADRWALTSTSRPTEAKKSTSVRSMSSARGASARACVDVLAKSGRGEQVDHTTYVEDAGPVDLANGKFDTARLRRIHVATLLPISCHGPKKRPREPGGRRFCTPYA